MSKFIIILIIAAFTATTSFTPEAMAKQNDYIFSSDFYNDVLYGTVAGLIIGLALGQGVSGTFKMGSIGMYGGIVLGLIGDATSDNKKPTYEENPSSDLSPKVPTYVLTFHY